MSDTPVFDERCPYCAAIGSIQFEGESQDDDGLEYYWRCKNCDTSFWNYAPGTEVPHT